MASLASPHHIDSGSTLTILDQDRDDWAMTTTNASRTVADAMTIPAITATPEETLETVAHRMQEHGVGSVVITDANRPVGILTERDLLRAAAGAAEPVTAHAG